MMWVHASARGPPPTTTEAKYFFKKSNKMEAFPLGWDFLDLFVTSLQGSLNS